MKLALVCPTIGQTKRGYERYMSDLFQVLKHDLDVTLFKGAGPSRAREQVVRHVTRTGRLSRLLGDRLRYRRSQVEFGTFALGLIRYLVRGDFDLVHVIDPPLAPWLYRLRRAARSRFRLLFTNGGPVSFDCSCWADHVHCPTPTVFEETKRVGVDPRCMTMLPVGFDTVWLQARHDRENLRRQAGIAADTFVILAITSLNRSHKRVDYLIEEVSALKAENILLWIDAGLHPDGDRRLLALAADRLGTRFRHTHVASEHMSELYRLADILVSTSLQEPFGMSIVEAMICGLPVITHDSCHFRWLVGEGGYFADMRVPGALGSQLRHLMRHRDVLQESVDPRRPIARFGWNALKDDYIRMYETAATDARPHSVRVQ